MGYHLGVDLGTTYTAVAIERDGRVDVLALGNHSATIPSLVFLREDDGVVIGDAAERRGQQEPSRLAREFKRRFGDTTPILLDRTPMSAERLTAMLLRQVIEEVAAREGGAPDAVCIAHPANWGQFKLDLLHQTAQLAGLTAANFVTEPVAAAVQFASTERVEVGDVVAVYDLGGGTFDVAILRKSATGFDTLGQPQGIERLGGIDFDEAVFAHVRRTLGDAITDLDTADPSVRAAIARVRAECVSAKEALSSDSEAVIQVMLPTVQTQVRITRAEFEDMVRPTLRETLDTLRRAISSSGVEPSALKSILLVGGSSRIPLVSDMVRGELGIRIVTDTHPKHSVAMGAARVAAASRSHAPQVAAVPPPQASTTPTPAAPVVAPAAAAAPVTAAIAPMTTQPSRPKAGVSTSRNTKIGVGVAAVIALGVVLFLALQKSDDPVTAVDTNPATTAVATTSVLTSETTTPGTATTTPVVTETCGASGLCAGIDSIDLIDDTYIVWYRVESFDPDVDAGPEHVHFFYDTVPISEAGVPGAGPWVVWDRAAGGGELVFNEFTLDNVSEYAGQDATAICIAVANHDHSVQADTLFCMPLPA